MKRATSALGIAALIGALLFPTSAASAASPGPYIGTTAASAIHHDLKLPNELTSTDVGLAGATVNSEGLQKLKTGLGWDLIAEPGGRSGALGGLASVKLNGSELIPAITEPRLARAIAPGDEPIRKVDLEQRVSTLAFARAIERTATPVWNGAACVIGEPMSKGTFQAAFVQAVGSDPGSATGPVKDPLVQIAGEADAPLRGAVDARSLTQLYQGAGSGFGLVAASMVTIAPVTLFAGTANEILIELAGPVILRARADGTPGGAAVTFQGPVVSVVRGGERQTLVPGEPMTLRLPSEDGVITVTIALGQLAEQKVASDGTTAMARGAAVDITTKVSTVTDRIAIGAVEADVQVPKDGITCQIPVTKTAVPDAVATGKPFTTTIVVENPYACDLTAVTLVDDITVKRAARFQITEAPNAIRKTAGSLLDRANAAWTLGEISAGGKKTATLKQIAQGSAGTIDDTATAQGRLVNCIVSLDGASTAVSGLGLGNTSVKGSGTLAVGISQVLGNDILPTTGVGSAAPIGLAMLAMASTLGALVRRTRSTG